jgi:hypothetical protein
MRYGGWLFISPSNFLILPNASILHNLNATFFPPWKRHLVRGHPDGKWFKVYFLGQFKYPDE